MSEQITVSGKIDRIIYDGRNNGKDNSFVIFSVSEPTGVPGKYQKHKVVGSAHSLVKEGEYVEVTGVSENSGYGDQIKMSQIFKADVDKTAIERDVKRHALTTLLKSHFFRGVGEGIAERIIDVTGMLDLDNPLEVLAYTDNLSALGSLRMAENISQSFQIKQEEIVSIYNILSLSDQITLRQARIALEDIGINAREAINQNPYILIGIEGVSFLTANDIAKSMGVAQESPHQIYAAVVFILQEEAGSNGHTLVSKESILKKARGLISSSKLSMDKIELAIKDSSDLVEVEGGLMLNRYYKAEVGIAKNLVRILNTPINEQRKENLERVIQALLDSGGDLGTGIKLSEEQLAGVAASVGSKVSVITGGPGVGKTTVNENVIQSLEEAGLRDIKCMTPTGKASKRMQESVKREATTIHRALGYTVEGDQGKGFFEKDKSNPLECSVVVVDETSMKDVELAHSLLEATPDDAIIVFIGDVDQLNSVGAGSVLRDFIASNALEVSRLTRIYRQGEDSGIVVKAHQVNNGKFKEFFEDITDYSDIKYLEINESKAKALSEKRGVELSADDLIVNLTSVKFKAMVERGFDPYKDIQVLTPMRKGLTGTHNLNRVIRDIANPNASNKSNPHVDSYEYVFYEGDKIIQTTNDSKTGIMNGDLGIIRSISRAGVVCDFDGQVVNMSPGEFKSKVDPAWAMTIHKSQGSEYKGVIMPLSKSHANMVSRSLLYTGMTRGKEMVELLGDKTVLMGAIKNNNSTPRKTFLKEAIQLEMKNLIITQEDSLANEQKSDLAFSLGIERDVEGLKPFR